MVEIREAVVRKIPARLLSETEQQAEDHPQLTYLELTVLQMAAYGETCKSTATLLGISTGHVKHLRHLALLKLGADHTAHAVAMAIRRSLIQ